MPMPLEFLQQLAPTDGAGRGPEDGEHEIDHPRGDARLGGCGAGARAGFVHNGRRRASRHKRGGYALFR
jgi:hypothetical protein